VIFRLPYGGRFFSSRAVNRSCRVGDVIYDPLSMFSPSIIIQSAPNYSRLATGTVLISTKSLARPTVTQIEPTETVPDRRRRFRVIEGERSR
jgi:hypothetical protein